MGLCITCRMLADKLAMAEPNPDLYKLRIGQYAKTFGHSSAHIEIKRLYDEKFGQIRLDQYTLGGSVRQQRLPMKAEFQTARQLMLSPTVNKPEDEMQRLYTAKFSEQSKWGKKNQRTYYYYTKKYDDTFWIVVTKNNASRIDKVVLGSFNDYNSRISRIWRATKQVSKYDSDGKFIRKWVEDLDPQSCGNNRIPSGVAFRLFKKLGLIRVIGNQGKVEYYQLTGTEPVKTNLERFINQEEGKFIISEA